MPMPPGPFGAGRCFKAGHSGPLWVWERRPAQTAPKKRRAQMSEPNLKKCPNCGSRKFYIDLPDGTQLFFSVDADGRMLASKEPYEPLEREMPEEIFCTRCAWHGSPDELDIEEDW